MDAVLEELSDDFLSLEDFSLDDDPEPSEDEDDSDDDDVDRESLR